MIQPATHRFTFCCPYCGLRFGCWLTVADINANKRINCQSPICKHWLRPEDLGGSLHLNISSPEIFTNAINL